MKIKSIFIIMMLLSGLFTSTLQITAAPIGDHEEATGEIEIEITADTYGGGLIVQQTNTDGYVSMEQYYNCHQDFEEAITVVTSISVYLDSEGTTTAKCSLRETGGGGGLHSSDSNKVVSALGWYIFNFTDAEVTFSGPSWDILIMNLGTDRLDWHYSEGNPYANGSSSWDNGEDACFKIYGYDELIYDGNRTHGETIETNSLDNISIISYTTDVTIKIPVSTAVTAIAAVRNWTGAIDATYVGSYDLLVNNTYWFDAANHFVYIRTTDLVVGQTINWSVNGTWGANAAISFPRYKDVGDDISLKGMITDSDGNALHEHIASCSVFYENGSLALGPYNWNCTGGNFEMYFSTTTLTPGTYSISIDFTDPITGFVYNVGEPLALSVDPPAGVTVGSTLYFNFYNNNTGFGIPIESLKVHADNELDLTSEDRLYAGIFNTYTGDTVYYNVTDYFGNIIYPNWGTSVPVGYSNNWDNDWQYSKTITIDHTKVPSTQTNFPILVHNTSSDFATHAQADGDDFAFIDSTNTTQYNHEIEKYNSTSGELTAWVNVSSLSSTMDTKINLYYGNAGASNQEHITDTWDSDFLAVFHLAESSGDILDSTVNANIGQEQGTATYGQTSVVGDGIIFSDDDYFTHVLDKDVIVENSFTVEYWQSGEQGMITGDFYSDKRSYFGIGGGQYAIGWGDDYEYYGGIPDSDWHYFVFATQADFDLDVFIDAVNQNGDSGVPLSSSSFATEADYNIGRAVSNHTSYNWIGMIDEVRFSNVIRSVDWGITTYATQSSPSTFASYSTESSGEAVTTSTSATNTSVAITSREQWIDIPIDWYSFSVKNMNHSIVRFKMTNGSTSYSRNLYPYEPFYWDVLEGEYTINLTYINPETGAVVDYNEEPITITDDTYYWIRGYDLQDIIIEITNTNSTIMDQIVNIGVTITNDGCELINQTLNLAYYLSNIESNITTQINSMWQDINNSNVTIINQVNSMWQTVNNTDSTIVTQANSVRQAIENTESNITTQLNSVWQDVNNTNSTVGAKQIL